jgi:hypothetical protein
LSESPSAKSLLGYCPNWVDLLRSIIALGLMAAWGNSIRQEDPASGKLVIGIIMAILVANRRTLFVPLPIFWHRQYSFQVGI